MNEIYEKQTGRPWLVVSFFTEANGYKPDAVKMMASCERFGLDYYVLNIKGEGSWLANVRYKPAFMQQMLAQHQGKNLVWIDVDGVVQQYPQLLDDLAGAMEYKDFIIGVHYFRKRELLTNTVFLRNCDQTMQLMAAWINLVKAMPGVWEQKILQLLLSQHPEWKVFLLPAGYSQIFDLMRYEGKPVIEHFQASRRFRTRTSPLATGSIQAIRSRGAFQ
jgi:hypothetical protein